MRDDIGRRSFLILSKAPLPPITGSPPRRSTRSCEATCAQTLRTDRPKGDVQSWSCTTTKRRYPTPSADDARLTVRLAAAADVLDIPLLDHLIVGDDGRYFSFRESGLVTGTRFDGSRHDTSLGHHARRFSGALRCGQASSLRSDPSG